MFLRFLVHVVIPARVLISLCLQAPCIAMRMESPLSAFRCVPLTHLSSAEAQAKIAEILVDEVIRRGVTSAVSKKNLVGRGSVYARISGLTVNALPEPLVALKPFIIVPPMTDDSASDMDLDVEVRSMAATVADGTGRALTAVLPEIKFVRRGNWLRENMLVQVKNLAYKAKTVSCTPIGIVAKVLFVIASSLGLISSFRCRLSVG